MVILLEKQIPVKPDSNPPPPGILVQAVDTGVAKVGGTVDTTIQGSQTTIRITPCTTIDTGIYIVDSRFVRFVKRISWIVSQVDPGVFAHFNPLITVAIDRVTCDVSMRSLSDVDPIVASVLNRVRSEPEV